MPANIQSINAGKIKVKNEQVILIDLCQFLAFLTLNGYVNRITLPSQAAGKGLRQSEFVFDDEKAHFGLELK